MSQILTAMSSKAANLGLALFHFTLAGVVGATLEDDKNPNVTQPVVYMINPNRGGPLNTSISIKWLIVAFTIVTGMFHLVYAYQGYAGRLRYIEYAITASTMIMIIQLLSGENDFIALLTVFALMATTMLMGFVQDEKLTNPGMTNASFWFAWVPYSVAWAVVIVRFFNTLNNASDPEAIPGFVKAIIWIELFFFTTFAFTQYFFVVRPGARYDLKKYDGTYNILSVLAKGLLVGFAYFGIKGMSEEDSN